MSDAPLTVAEVVKHLKSSKRSVLALIHSKRLLAFDMRKPGKRRAEWRIEPDDLDRFKRERKTFARPHRRVKKSNSKEIEFF